MSDFSLKAPLVEAIVAREMPNVRGNAALAAVFELRRSLWQMGLQPLKALADGGTHGKRD